MQHNISTICCTGKYCLEYSFQILAASLLETVQKEIIGMIRHLENRTYAKIRRNQRTCTAERRELVRENIIYENPMQEGLNTLFLKCMAART